MARKMDGGKGSREGYWRRHVAGWVRSGESVRGYCRSRGVSEAAFHFWKRELKRRDAGAVTKAERPVFAEGRLAPSVVREAFPSAGLGARIEIAVSGSRRIQVHPGFDEETLLRVVAAVERAAC